MKLANELVNALESAQMTIKQFALCYDLNYERVARSIYAAQFSDSERVAIEHFINYMGEVG